MKPTYRLLILCVSFFSFNAIASTTWYVDRFGSSYNRSGVQWDLAGISSERNALCSGTASRNINGTTYTGSVAPEGQYCMYKFTFDNGGNGALSQQISFSTVVCPAGKRPNSASDTSCTDFADAYCPDGQSSDPVTGECVDSDGTGEGDDGSIGDGDTGGDTGGGDTGGGTPECNSSDSCLTEAQAVCASYDQTIMDYQYYGGSQYNLSCGYEEYDCGTDKRWDKSAQLCLTDTDGDGTGDPFDPEPENPDENGDSDGDGVADSQDSHPNDPSKWNESGSYTGGTVAPVGTSEQFNDSAIVEAVNQNTLAQNATTENLDKISKQTGISNDILQGLFDNSENSLGILGTESPDGQSATDLETGADAALDALENEVASKMGESLDQGLFISPDDLGFVETMFGTLQLEKCENVSNFLFTIPICELAPIVNPILYWAFAAFTIVACFHTIIATLKTGGQ